MMMNLFSALPPLNILPMKIPIITETDMIMGK
jgi:hypothetical protein